MKLADGVPVEVQSLLFDIVHTAKVFERIRCPISCRAGDRMLVESLNGFFGSSRLVDYAPNVGD